MAKIKNPDSFSSVSIGRLGAMSSEEAADEFISKFRLTDRMALLQTLLLLEDLVSSEGHDHDAMVTRRQSLSNALLAVKTHAKNARIELERVRDESQKVINVISDGPWSNSLFEQALDIEPLPFNFPIMPDPISAIVGCKILDDRYWHKASQRLSDLENISLKRGTQRQSDLISKALRVCRQYVRHEGLRWKIDSMDKAGVLDSDDRDRLTGLEERIVVDLLIYAQIDFSFSRLNTSWRRLPKLPKLKKRTAAKGADPRLGTD